MKKVFKKTLSTSLSSVFAFTSLFSALPNDIFADEVISKGTTTDGFTYEITADCVAVTGYTGEITENMTLNIPQTIENNAVTKISYFSFMDIDKLTAVTIPDTVKEIGTRAFEGTSISEIDLPDSLEKLGYCVFAECKNLKKIEIPLSLKNCDVEPGSPCCGPLGYSCIEEVVLPNDMTVIPDNLCRCLDTMDSVIIPDTVKEIGSFAFAGCDGLKEITIPSGVEKAERSFDGSALETVHFEDEMKIIPEQICSYTKKLKTIDFPADLEEIGKRAFCSCESLETLHLPEGLQKIDHSAFTSCTALSDLTFPETLTYIGGSAFQHSDSLKYVYLPSNIDTTLSEQWGWFSYSGLEKIEFAPDMTVIPYDVVSHCHNLTDIIFPTAPEKISDRAFEDCTLLKNVDIPDTVKEIGQFAFSGAGVENLHLPTSLEQLSGGAFEKTKSLKKLYVPLVTLQDTSYSSFKDSGIERLEFAEGTEKIYAHFSNLPNLNTLILPDSVKAIEQNAFQGSTSLQNVKLPENLEYIGWGAFSGCTQLTEITIPKNVTECGYQPFADSGIEVITFEDGMEIIPENICTKAHYLKAAVIPESVKKIESAFSECENLTTLDMKQESIEFDPTAFHGDDKLNDKRVNFYNKNATFLSSTSPDGELINYTLHYEINSPFFEKMTEAYFEIYCSNDNLLVKESLPVGIETNGKEIKFSPSEQSGTFNFSIRPDESGGIPLEITGYAKCDGEYWHKVFKETVNLNGLSVMKNELKCPDSTAIKDDKCELYISGCAKPDSEIEIYVDGEKISNCQSNKYTGRYSSLISCNAKEEGGVYEVYAVCGEDKSNICKVKVDSKTPQLISSTLTHDNSHGEYTIDLTDCLLNGKTPYIAYNPSNPLSFEVELSDNNCKSAAVTSTVNGETSAIELKYNPETKKWCGEGYFATKIPGELNIAVDNGPKPINLTQKKDKDGNVEITVSDGTKMVFLDKNGKNQLKEGYLKDTDTIDTIMSHIDSEIAAYDDNGFVTKSHYEYGDSESDFVTYVGQTDSITLHDTQLSPEKVAENPESFGFTKSPVTLTDENGKVHNYYVMVSDNADTLEGISKNITVGKEKSLHENVLEISDTVGKFTSGTILLDYALGEKGKFVSSFVTEGGKALLQVSYKGASTVFKNLDLIEYTRIGTDGLTMIDAALKSDSQYAKENRGLLIASATALTAARVGVNVWTGSIATGAITVAGTAFLAAGTVMCSAVIVPVAVAAVTITAINLCSGYIFNKLTQYYMELVNGRITPGGKINTLIDPSGYAYECIPSNRIKGVTATIYYKDADGKETMWNADDYGQLNPQITDAAGWFAWDVPEGLWQVRFTAEGYEDYATEWLPVLPVQLNVNVPLKSTLAPEIAAVEAAENKLIITFSNFIDDSTVTPDSLFVTKNGKSVACKVKPIKSTDNNTAYSKEFEITSENAAFAVGDKLELTKNVLCHTGIACNASSVEITAVKKAEYLLGDVDNDGTVDASDASAVLAAYAAVQTGSESPLNETQKKAADVDSSGQIDASDASTILAYYAFVQTGSAAIGISEFMNH